jgi:6,7-dimethyl-8-ribityllumazine synthase
LAAWDGQPEMLQDLHIGRSGLKPSEAETLIRFLGAIGFERMYESQDEKHSALFTAPRGVLSINLLSHAPELAGRVIVVGVTNPDVVFDLARKFNFKVLSDSAGANAGARAFSLDLPGGIELHVIGGSEEPAPGLEGKLDATGRRFALVVSRFNAFISERLLQGARDALRRSGARPTDITVVRVPGSFEIPSAARTLAETRQFDAIVCLGCLLRGDTAHYDVIVNEVARGIGQSAQETGVPHSFGVLTCETLEQAIDRAGLKMGNKGFEAALAAVEMASLQTAVRGRSSAGRKTSVPRPKSAGAKRKPGKRASRPSRSEKPRPPR